MAAATAPAAISSRANMLCLKRRRLRVFVRPLCEPGFGLFEIFALQQETAVALSEVPFKRPTKQASVSADPAKIGSDCRDDLIDAISKTVCRTQWYPLNSSQSFRDDGDVRCATAAVYWHQTLVVQDRVVQLSHADLRGQ